MLNGVAAEAVGLILSVALELGSRELKAWRDLPILIAAFVPVGILHVSLVPVLVVLVPIAIQLNRPNQTELAEYHARQASYHAQLAKQHGEAGGRHLP